MGLKDAIIDLCVFILAASGTWLVIYHYKEFKATGTFIILLALFLGTFARTFLYKLLRWWGL